MSKYLPLVLVLIALIMGISYFHETEVTSVNRDEIHSGQAAPSRSDIPL